MTLNLKRYKQTVGRAIRFGDVKPGSRPALSKPCATGAFSGFILAVMSCKWQKVEHFPGRTIRVSLWAARFDAVVHVAQSNYHHQQPQIGSIAGCQARSAQMRPLRRQRGWLWPDMQSPIAQALLAELAEQGCQPVPSYLHERRPRGSSEKLTGQELCAAEDELADLSITAGLQGVRPGSGLRGPPNGQDASDTESGYKWTSKSGERSKRDLEGLLKSWLQGFH